MISWQHAPYGNRPMDWPDESGDRVPLDEFLDGGGDDDE